MDLVFFLYGLAFFTLGVTVLAQPRRETSDLVRCMWLLGGFGITHGVCEWVYLLDISRGPPERYEPVHLVLSSGSFLFLFEFGRRLLRLALRPQPGAQRYLRWTTAPYAYTLILLGAIGHMLTPGELTTGLHVWLRYTVAFPGAMFTAIGFQILARNGHGETGCAVRSTFGSLAYILLAYGLLSVVVPPAPFFPASVINSQSFRQLFGIPVQVPGTAVAWIAAVAVGSLFHLFHRAARRELRDALTEANRLQQHSEIILETTDDAICGVERGGRVTFANRAAGDLLGCPSEQLLGRPFKDFRVRPVDAPQAHGPEFPCPVPYRSDGEHFSRADGTEFPVDYSSTPRYENGQLTCAVLAFRDITQRRQSELAERWEQQQRFRAVFEQAAVGMALVSTDGVCLQVNERLCWILGRPAEALLETPFDRVINPDDQAKCNAAKTSMIRDKTMASKVVELRCSRGDNQVVWVQLALSLVRDQSSAPMYCVLVVDDITERKVAETALLHSQKDLQRSQSIARLGSWELDLYDLGMNWSEEALNILGWPEDTQPNLRDFLSATHAQDRANMESTIEGWFSGRGRRNLEYRIVRPDGEPRFIDLSVRFEYAADGSPSRAVGTIQDISERKRTDRVLEFYRTRLEQLVEERTAELKASNRELASINRELEAFSYSVSHDLRSPLRAINGFTQALEEDYGEWLDEEGLGYIGRVRSATVRMGELIDGLLNLSRVFRSEFDAESVDLSAFAAEVVRQLRAGEPDRTIEIDIEPNLTATGDPTLLRLLLQNLIGNAWKFTAGKPDARIVFGRHNEGLRGTFRVRDNGVGFEMEYAHQLFKPFHRLHAHGEYDGTGIGLATVRRIVQRHGGQVWAEGRPGAGATIYFTLESDTYEHSLRGIEAADQASSG